MEASTLERLKTVHVKSEALAEDLNEIEQKIANVQRVSLIELSFFYWTILSHEKRLLLMLRKED